MAKYIAVTLALLVVTFLAQKPTESQAQGLVEIQPGAKAVAFAVAYGNVGLVGWVVPTMLGGPMPVEYVLWACQTWENKDGGLIQNVPLSMCGDDSNLIRPIPEGVVINGCALGETDCLAKLVPPPDVKDNAVIRCMQFENVEPGGEWVKIPKSNCLVPPPN